MPCVGDTVQRVSRFPIALGPKQFPRRFKKTNRHYVVGCVTQIYQGGLSCRLERLIFSIGIFGIPSSPFSIAEYGKGVLGNAALPNIVFGFTPETATRYHAAPGFQLLACNE